MKQNRQPPRNSSERRTDRENDYLLRKRYRAAKGRLPKVQCAVCDKNIQDPVTALSVGGEGKPVHFQCALDNVKNSSELREGERVAYIGKGKFGVVSGKSRAVVHRVIPFESVDNIPDWRKNLIKVPGFAV